MSALAPVPASSTPPDGVPYVGLRPFRAEERHLFFGRDSDAQFLADKILSARITLLYAPSGIGKSSLLRASVIPSLETEDCRVIYFDSWAGADAVAEFKKALSEVARATGIADPLAGSPTIAELVRLAATDGKTMVLVLDQFEEFLINHASSLDPLRKEIGALVRSQSVDARVVISLREEFLAAIEPFREEILTLFQSTFRLESLSAADVQKAIVKPAAQFGGEVEAQLATRLAADLSETPGIAAVSSSAYVDVTAWEGWRTWIRRILDRTGRRRVVSEAVTASDDPAPGNTPGAGTIDLPMLQLVCEHLWRAATTVEGQKKLTLDLYENQLGGKKKILGDHIRSRMPENWNDRFFTATLMRFLAPPSGLKISYSAADLSAYSGLNQQRVEAELKRLSGPSARILRQREFRENVRFELQHDALIRHITPWRDAVLAEAAAMKRLRWALSVILVVLVLVAVERGYHSWQVGKNTDDLFENIKTATNRTSTAVGNDFERAASYLLFQEQGMGRFDRLKKLLIKNENLLPEDYLTGSSDSTVNASFAPSPGDSLAMRFNPSWTFDVQSFNRAWSDEAHRMTDQWGIPVPTRVRLIADSDFPRAAVQFEFEQAAKPTRVDLDLPEGMALVSIPAEAPRPVLEFHRRFVQEWFPLHALETVSDKSTWWAVPRWSLPVWRTAGLRVWSASAYPAFALMARLDRNPTVLLTPSAVEFLVQHVAQEYPCTAEEVWALRGSSKLRQDLIGWMGTSPSRPLTDAHLVFDAISDLRVQNSSKPLQKQQRYLEGVDKAFADAWPQSGSSAPPCTIPNLKVNTSHEYESLPQLRPKIRIALGDNLVSSWTRQRRVTSRVTLSAMPSQVERPAEPSTEDQATDIGWSPELAEALQRYRETLYRRTGIWLPKVTWVDNSSEFSGNREYQLRVLLLDAQDQEETPVDATTTEQGGIDRLISALDKAVMSSSLAWVDAEFAATIAEKKHNQKLLKTLEISVTDLKLLLRAVLSREKSKEKAIASDERSIRDSEWLIPSLVFWKAYYTHDNAPTVPELLPDLARGLRRLQAQRNVDSTASRNPELSRIVQRGIQELEEGNAENAGKSFEEALDRWPREDVEKLFVSSYAARFQASRRVRIDQACTTPTNGKLDSSLRIEVEALLEEPGFRQNLAAARKLALCLVSSMPSSAAKAKSSLRLKISREYGEPKAWLRSQAAWLATQMLEQYDVVRDPGDVVDQGSRFLLAVIRDLPSDEANMVFNNLLGVCNRPGSSNWCWAFLPKVVETRPDPWNAVDLALAFSSMESNSEAQLALHWIDRARALFGSAKSQTKANRERFDFWDGYVRASAFHVLGINGDNTKLDEAQRLIPSFVDAPATSGDSYLEDTAVTLALRLLSNVPKPDRAKADAFHKRLVESSRDDATFFSHLIFYELRLGNDAKVKQLVLEAYNKASTIKDKPEERAELLFPAAAGGLLTEPKDYEWAARQFIRTGHLYAPPVSMLLSARTKGVVQASANELLEERWERVDPKTWDKRLRAGNRQAWYEMLVGYFVGKVPAEQVFDPLRDDSTLAGSRFAGLNVPRKALMTEAYFYDALRLMAAGDEAGSSASLKRVIDLDHKNYIEYDIAVHLLRQGNRGP